MRKRKRPEWPIVVYKFWAEPIGPVPEELWAQAKGMQATWNRLVELYEQATGEAADKDAETRRKRWEQYRCEKDLYIRSSEVTDRLDWAAREAVFDRFRLAERMTRQKGTRLRRQERLERINIPHRFTAGGVPASRLFNSRRASLVRLRPVPEDAYLNARRETVRRRITRGEFRVGQEAITFRTILHRPLPEDAIVKALHWCGSLHAMRGWQWSINITVEVPPRERRSGRGRACSLDLGWRLMGDYLRIGMVYDSSANLFELRLPLSDTGTSFTRRYGLPDSFTDLIDLDSRLGNLVEECKARLREVLPQTIPAVLREAVESLPRAREGGLIRLRRALEQHAGSSQGQEFALALEALRSWSEQNDAVRKRRHDTCDRLVGRRRWLYSNLAAWLARRYDRIIWEGNLRVGELASSLSDPDRDTNKFAVEHSRRHRVWAAPGELQEFIRRAARREGCELIHGETAYSTTTCARCGRRCEPSPKLYITCPCGHRFDQDANACANLLMSDGVSMSSDADPVIIPEALRRVVVRLD